MKNPTKEMENPLEKVLRNTIWLGGLYVAAQLAADVAAVKMVSVGPWSLPAGTLIFALTFTLRDIIHEKLGYKTAVHIIWSAAMANAVLAAYLLFATWLTPAVWWQGQAAFAATLSLVPRITLASIVAEVFSELLDTLIYQFVKDAGRAPWLRTLLSNAGGLALDTFVFATLAFAGTMPLAAWLAIVAGQIVFKSIVTVVSLPLVWRYRRAR
jgi:uncharacterized integral membrane protein (TIGR00697 family)